MGGPLVTRDNYYSTRFLLSHSSFGTISVLFYILEWSYSLDFCHFFLRLEPSLRKRWRRRKRERERERERDGKGNETINGGKDAGRERRAGFIVSVGGDVGEVLLS